MSIKEKLIKKIKDEILKIGDDTEIIVDYNEENKDEILEELFVPFMETFGCESLGDLKEKIGLLFENDKIEDVLDVVAESLLDDIEEDEIESLFDNIEHFVQNVVAIKNKLSDEESFKLISNDIEEYIKNFNDTDEPKEENDDDSNVDNSTVDEDTENNSEENSNNNADNEPENNEPEDNTPENNEPKDNESVKDDLKDKNQDNAKSVTFKIINPNERVDETPWSDVNKIELKNKLMDAYESADEAGKKKLQKVIDEVFALVKSYDKMGDWKWPHHSIKENDVLLNVNGLRAAALFLLKPNTSKNLTSEEKSKIAKHLLRHYNEIKEEAPERLTKIAENKESVIIFNIKDDEYKNLSESFNVNEEDVYVYVGLMESLLTDLINSGIISVETEDENVDESVMTVKLDNKQIEEMLHYFDIMSNDILNIIDGNLDKLSYKKTKISDESIKEVMEENTTLKDEIKELTEKLEERNQMIEEAKTKEEENKITNHKFMTIINFIKAIDNVDESLVQFINNVIEAETEKEVDYLFKIGKTFMKATKSKPRFKKVSNITGLNNNKIFDLLDNDAEKEESGLSKINKKVETLADYFD